MSKNKRWKRQAKKLLGECIKNESVLCKNCNATEQCSKVFGYTGYIPVGFGIRVIEERCKYANIFENVKRSIVRKDDLNEITEI